MDYTDLKILKILRENSRLTNKEIGEKIHMISQAVGNRINQLIERGEISKFTIM
ncbi:winged helix-turn-helix transcriptional regulator [Macrococcoides goetzii]|uniref:winged helix-turn-helix transcriptional regulator n=1 Tax=Macrococcoides goetzii TaxID=1891097 RepID=UPI00197B2615|nr:AsnC family transcriptional regulator [Macrococcus goetzii]